MEYPLAPNKINRVKGKIYLRILNSKLQPCIWTGVIWNCLHRRGIGNCRHCMGISIRPYGKECKYQCKDILVKELLIKLINLVNIEIIDNELTAIKNITNKDTNIINTQLKSIRTRRRKDNNYMDGSKYKSIQTIAFLCCRVFYPKFFYHKCKRYNKKVIRSYILKKKEYDIFKKFCILNTSSVNFIKKEKISQQISRLPIEVIKKEQVIKPVHTKISKNKKLYERDEEYTLDSSEDEDNCIPLLCKLRSEDEQITEPVKKKRKIKYEIDEDYTENSSSEEEFFEEEYYEKEKLIESSDDSSEEENNYKPLRRKVINKKSNVVIKNENKIFNRQNGIVEVDGYIIID